MYCLSYQYPNSSGLHQCQLCPSSQYAECQLLPCKARWELWEGLARQKNHGKEKLNVFPSTLFLHAVSHCLMPSTTSSCSTVSSYEDGSIMCPFVSFCYLPIQKHLTDFVLHMVWLVSETQLERHAASSPGAQICVGEAATSSQK